MPAPGSTRPPGTRLNELAVATTGERVIFVTSLGSTETAPAALACAWDFDRPGNIGLPCRGVELKLVPNDGKLEARLRGPHITPGYWRQRASHARRLRRGRLLQDRRRAEIRRSRRSVQGPAVRRPHRRGLQAVDRHLGQRRPLARPLHRPFRALVRDVVFAGPDRRRYLSAGVPRFRGLPQARRCSPPTRRRSAVLDDPAVRAMFAERLASLAATSPGLLDARGAADPDGRAAIDGQRRDDRQGLDQPARRAEEPRRAGRRSFMPRRCRRRRSRWRKAHERSRAHIRRRAGPRRYGSGRRT